jgi:Flp pilus assembly protein TadG
MRAILQQQLRIADWRLQITNRFAGRSVPIRNPQSEIRNRRGAVAVEFAVVAPVLVALVFGMIQYGRAFEMQNQLQVAAREGARFASLDHTGMLASGQTSNQKLIQDVKNFLATYGIANSDVTVQVKDHANPSSDFNIDDPNNNLKLFDVKVSVNFSKVALQPVSAGNDYALTAKVVFRNGRATVSQ